MSEAPQKLANGTLLRNMSVREVLEEAMRDVHAAAGTMVEMSVRGKFRRSAVRDIRVQLERAARTIGELDDAIERLLAESKEKKDDVQPS